MPRVVPGKNGGLDIQRMAMSMVVPKDNSSAQRTDFSLNAMKTDDNAESCT